MTPNVMQRASRVEPLKAKLEEELYAKYVKRYLKYLLTTKLPLL